MKGLVERQITALPGVTEHRFNQLQEIEAVLNLLNIKLLKIRRTHFQKYLEKYQRALTSRDAEKYVDGEDEAKIPGLHFNTGFEEPLLINSTAEEKNHHITNISIGAETIMLSYFD